MKTFAELMGLTLVELRALEAGVVREFPDFGVCTGGTLERDLTREQQEEHTRRAYALDLAEYYAWREAYSGGSDEDWSNGIPLRSEEV